MAVNTDPIYSRAGDIQWADAVIGPSALTTLDGTGTNIYPVWQADTTNGGFLRSIRAKPVGSPAATVMRIFICSVTGAFTAGTSNTAANTVLYDEITLPAITASGTAAMPTFEAAMNFAMPAGYRILVGFHTSTGASGTGYRVAGIGGEY